MTTTDLTSFTFRLEQDDHYALRRIALDEGRPAAEIVRQLVREYVEKNGAPAVNGDPDGPSEAQKSA